MASTPESPFLMASLSYGPFLITQTKEAFQLGVVPKNNDISKSLEGAYRELLRATRYGFTQEELDRAKEEIQSSYQMSYNNRNSRTNTQYAEEYVRNFTSGEPIPGIEVENQLVQLLLTELPLEIVNGVVSEIVTPDNRVLMVMQPQRKGFKLPTKNELAKVLSSVDQKDLKPYVEESIIDTLLPTLPAPGKIITETKNLLWDATEITLSNGIKVIVKPTDFRQDEVLFMAIAPGGTSTLPDEMNSSLAFLPYLAGSITIGDFSTTDLRKYLSGKKVEFVFDFNAYYRSALGSSTVKDLPTLMELIYGYMTEANINQKDFESKQTLFSSALANAEADPQQVFSKLMTESVFQNSRKHYISQKAIDEATEDQIREIVRAMTYNPQDYTFVFVGNIDIEQFKPLLEQYIATLPEGNSNHKSSENSKNNLEDLEDNGLALKVTTNPTINTTLSITSGEHRSDFTMEMSTPQSTMAVIKTANMPTTEINFYLSRIAGAILEQRLIETVREELGAVYSISAAGNMSSTLASPNVQITSILPLKPECVEPVLEVFKKEFTNMESDIKEEELQKALEYLIKNNAEALEENSSWRNALAYNTLSGIAPLIKGQEVLKSITTQDVMNFLKEVNSQRNLQIVTLSPAN